MSIWPLHLSRRTMAARFDTVRGMGSERARPDVELRCKQELSGNRASSLGRDDGALSDRAQFFFAVFDHEDFALTDGLPLSNTFCVSPGNKKRSDRRFQIIDLEFRGERISTKRQPTSECDRVIRQITDHAAMDEAVLLLQMVNDWNAQFSASGS